MGRKLSDSLSQFISTKDHSFENPFREEEEKIDIEEFIERTESTKKEKKKYKKDPFEEMMKQSEALSTMWDEDDAIQDLEGYIEGYLLDDEDEELRRNLIKYGRKYARDTKQSGESSELEKAYAQQEAALEELIRDVGEDKEALGGDIKKLRSYRSVNFKSFADLVEAKTSLHNTHLQAIKELDSIIKNKAELQMKLNKEKSTEEGDDSVVANRMIQNLFSMGRDNLIGSYEEVSGANSAGNYQEIEGFNEDDIIEERYLKEEDYENETDGDKYLRYEEVFDHLVLEYNDRGPVQTYAVDKDGNPIPDYPIGDMNELEFNISESTQTATDNLSQNYEAIKVDE